MYLCRNSIVFSAAAYRGNDVACYGATVATGAFIAHPTAAPPQRRNNITRPGVCTLSSSLYRIAAPALSQRIFPLVCVCFFWFCFRIALHLLCAHSPLSALSMAPETKVHSRCNALLLSEVDCFALIRSAAWLVYLYPGRSRSWAGGKRLPLQTDDSNFNLFVTSPLGQDFMSYFIPSGLVSARFVSAQV